MMIHCIRCGQREVSTRVGGSPWLTPDVVALSRAAYEERSPDGSLDPVWLAILADALLDAGCDNEDLLGHLRGFECPARCVAGTNRHKGDMSCCAEPRRGAHVRGCWALDLILAKE